MTDVRRMASLIQGAVRAPEEEIHGASAEELATLKTRLDRDLPAELADILTVCNGAAIGPGGLFGQRPDEPHLDLPSYLELFPGWARKGWIPVAGDGCGNYYVLLTDGSVGFVDTTEPDVAEGTGHADLSAFMEAILIGDQSEH